MPDHSFVLVLYFIISIYTYRLGLGLGSLGEVENCPLASVEF